MFRCGRSSLQHVRNSFSRVSALVYKPELYVRYTMPRNVNEFDKEQVAYKKVLKQYRLKNIKDYWERQTQVENEYLANYNKIQRETHIRNLIRERDAIVKIAGATQRHIEQRLKNEGKKLANLEKHRLNEEAKRANRARILELLNFDSKTWYTQENIEDKMVEEVLIPDFVYHQTAYYLNLQEQALLYEDADFEGLEENITEYTFVKEKNEKLTPIYAELVSLIKQITYTQEVKYLEDYNHLKAVIEDKKELSEEDKKAKVDKIRKSYKQLIDQWKAESNSPSAKVNNLYEQLVFLYNLMRLWKGYIDLVKMDKYQFEAIFRKRDEDDVPVAGLYGIEQPGKAAKVRADHLSDAQTSANEKVTTGSEAESDIERNQFEEPVNQPKDLKKILEETRKAFANAEKTISEKNEDEDIFNTLRPQSTESLEKEFEEQFAQAEDKERFLYGGQRDARAIEAAELLKMTSIESFIPQEEIDRVRDFSEIRLEYPSVDKIEEEEILPPKENVDKLNTSALVEAYKRVVSEIEASESLSRREKNRIVEIKKLLNKIGEIRVQEGRLLLKVFETYKPKYTLD